INTSAAGIPLSVVVRIYQLKDNRNFDSADYQALFTGDSEVLAGDIIAQKDVWLQPGGSVAVDMPLDDAAKFTGVAAMFLEPDRKKNTWRVVLSLDELEPDTPRLIEVSGNTLTLLPVKDK
ncbi:type VI secretion system lipoprotein TssJ, partial [Escherichia coli]|nr:type VI secretion system lipoprotein TssJ [Escherichia coli]